MEGSAPRRWKLPRAQGSFGRILENAAWLLGGKGVGGFLSLFYLAILARTLGPGDFGRFALILATSQTIGLIVSFETWQIVVKYGQQHLAAGREDSLMRVIRLCTLIDLAAALVGCAAAVAATLLFGERFGLSADQSAAAALFCVATLICFRSTPGGILRLFDRFDTGALAETMVPIGRMVGALAVLAVGPSVIAFLIAWAAAEWLCSAAYWYFAVRLARSRGTRWHGERLLPESGENSGLGSFLAASNVSTSVTAMSRQIVMLMVGFFVGPAAAGLYRLSAQINLALTKVAGLLSRSMFAELSRVHAHESADSLRRIAERSNRLALVAGVIIVAVLLVAGKPLLHLIAGEAFLGAYPLLVALGLAAALEVVGLSFEPLLLATGRARVALVIRLVNAALLCAMLAFLLPRFGEMGAAYANLASSVLAFFMLGFVARRHLARI